MDEIDFFISQLKSEDFGVRLNAIQALGEFQDLRAVGDLLSLLSEPEWQIRNAAIESIVNIKDHTIIDTVANYLRSDDANLRNAAMQVMEKMGGDVVTPLCKNLEDKDDDVRIFAANTLGNIGDKSATPSLLKALNDKNENVFYAVVEALGKIGDSSAMEDLLIKLKEKDIWDRFVIISTLGLMGDERAVKSILTQFEYEELKLAVIDALSKIKFEGSLPQIVSVINNDPDTDIKIEGLKALFSIGLQCYNFARIERNSILSDFLLKNFKMIDFRSLEPLIVEVFKSENTELKEKIINILNWVNIKFPIKPIIDLLRIEELEEKAYDILLKQNDIDFKDFKEIFEKEDDDKIKALLIKSLGFRVDAASKDFLENMLSVDNPTFIVAASEALLLQLSDSDVTPNIIDKLFNLIRDSKGDVKNTAKSVLVVLAHLPEVQGKLKSIFSQKNDKLIKEAIEIVSISNNSNFFDNVISFVEHPSSEIKKEVFQTINYLSKIESNRNFFIKHQYIDKVYNGVYDKDDYVKIEAIYALGSLNTEKSFEILKSILYDSSFSYFKPYIVRAIKECGRKSEIIDIFIELLKSGIDIETKLIIINAFREFNDPRPIECISDMLFEESEDDIKGEILITIGELGQVDELDFILPFFDDDNWYIKNAAVISLSKIVDDRVKLHLIELLKNSNKIEDEIIIKNIIAALKSYPDQDTLGVLIPYLSNNIYSFYVYETIFKIVSESTQLSEQLFDMALSQNNTSTIRLAISILRELKIFDIKDKLISLYNSSDLESIKFSILCYMRALGIDDTNLYCENISEESQLTLLNFLCSKKNHRFGV